MVGFLPKRKGLMSHLQSSIYQPINRAFLYISDFQSRIFLLSCPLSVGRLVLITCKIDESVNRYLFSYKSNMR